MSGLDGADGVAVVPADLDAGTAAPDEQLRVGWFTDCGMGPIDPEVARTVREAADALPTRR